MKRFIIISSYTLAFWNLLQERLSRSLMVCQDRFEAERLVRQSDVSTRELEKCMEGVVKEQMKTLPHLANQVKSRLPPEPSHSLWLCLLLMIHVKFVIGLLWGMVGEFMEKQFFLGMLISVPCSTYRGPFTLRETWSLVGISL